MKTHYIIFGIVLFLFGCNSAKQTDKELLNILDGHLNEERFFKLIQCFEDNKTDLSPTHKKYFQALIDKSFNRPEKSNEAIRKLLSDDTATLSDTMLYLLYKAKLNNHINLFEYAGAAKTSAYIQNNFPELFDSSEMEMLQNEIKIWEGLKNVPKQEIIRNNDATIPMYRDKVGLFNVDVSIGDSTKNLLFDTGANFSVIVKSLVDQLDLTYIDADFYVTAATGKRVKSGIAIADEISFGNIAFRNVFFLVLNDEDLSFPQIDYYPNGAIGFPVIEAMEEIRINKDNEIFVPTEPIEYTFNNFALNGLMPVVAGIHDGDTLRFNFDTGATATTLYPLFYSKYQHEINTNYEKETFQSGSGGGTIEFEGYVLDTYKLAIADSEAVLDEVRLHSEKFGKEEMKVHGNFGQDYIKQFDEMIISFKYSSVLFR